MVVAVSRKVVALVLEVVPFSRVVVAPALPTSLLEFESSRTRIRPKRSILWCCRSRNWARRAESPLSRSDQKPSQTGRLKPQCCRAVSRLAAECANPATAGRTASIGARAQCSGPRVKVSERVIGVWGAEFACAGDAFAPQDDASALRESAVVFRENAITCLEAAIPLWAGGFPLRLRRSRCSKVCRDAGNTVLFLGHLSLYWETHSHWSG